MSDEVGPWVRGRTLARRAATGLFEAADRATGRAVSLRAPLVGIADERAARAELAREAAVLSRFGPHEAVLALAADESSLSPPRLVLEGGELTSLAEILAGGALGLDAALAIVLPIADALRGAHAAGVAHGRLSPACVLVSSRGTPKLALFADAAAEGIEMAPPREVALDDPAWLAPEVLMGEPATPASDVHGLACLFVEIVAGRHPHSGEHDDAEGGEPGARLGFAASLARVRDRLGPILTAGAAAALTRALAKHPGDRQRDADELLADLARFVPAAAVRSPLADALAARAGRPLPRPTSGDDDAPARVSVLPFLAIGAVLALAGALAFVAGRGSEAPPEAAVATGRLRILARPWANVSLDGAPLDVTPIGAPVVVAPGRHVVDFVHPSAPKVQRVVEVAPGRTVVVDVILDVPPPAAPSASATPSP